MSSSLKPKFCTLLTFHSVPELSCYFLNCVKGSESKQLTLASGRTTPNVQSNHRVWFFLEELFLKLKNTFFGGFGGPKIFLGTPIPLLYVVVCWQWWQCMLSNQMLSNILKFYETSLDVLWHPQMFYAILRYTLISSECHRTSEDAKEHIRMQ